MSEKNDIDDKKNHPWRRCPQGKHFVNEYKEHVQPSEQHPDGIKIIHGHCSTNPSHKRKLLSARLKREVTWEEAVIEYKSYWGYIDTHRAMPKGIIDLRDYYKRLQGS